MKYTSDAGSGMNEIEKKNQEIERLNKLVEFLAVNNQALTVNNQALTANNQALQEALVLANKEKDALAKKLRYFTEQLSEARRQMFGSSSEKSEPDINLFNESESEADPKAEEPTNETIATPKRRKKPAHARATMNDDLPTETIRHEPSAEELVCPACGNTMSVMAWREYVEMVLAPAVIKRLIHLYPVLYCKTCRASDEGSTIVEPQRPAPLLPKTMASPSLVSHIITQKYMMGLPLYRQQQEWEQLGIQLSRQTQSNWLLGVSEAYLKPMRERMRHHLVQQNILHADETPLQVLKEPGRAAETKSYMWVYLSGREGLPIILYDYRTTRAAKHPQAFLKDFKGYLHADGYQGYHDLRNITVAGCWAHARRRFFIAVQAIPEANRTKELSSVIGLDYCDQLYAVEQEVKAASPEERHAKRQELSLPILLKFNEWLKMTKSTALASSLLGDAIKYCLNQWTYLETYTRDGRLEIDNNRAERAVKSFVIGRRNWLFSNAPSGAESSAAMYSIVRTAIANGLRAEGYLRWLFERFPTIDIKDKDSMDALMPWSPDVPEDCRMSATERAAAEAAIEND